MQRVEFPDILATLVDYLPTELAAVGFPVHVVTRVPNPRPSQFVRVDRVGGTKQNLVVDAATVIVEAWADISFDAFQLAKAARSIVNGMAGEDILGTLIYRVGEFGGPATHTDPESDQARVSLTFSIETRGIAA